MVWRILIKLGTNVKYYKEMWLCKFEGEHFGIKGVMALGNFTV